MFSLEFEAWISHIESLDTDEPTEYFSKTFNTIQEAKDFLINDCFLWKEGEWADSYITISFGNEPGIFDEKGKLLSRCVMENFEDREFNWVDV
jgi:hypothetical protein